MGEAGAVGWGDVHLPRWRLCRHQMEVDKPVKVLKSESFESGGFSKSKF